MTYDLPEDLQKRLREMFPPPPSYCHSCGLSPSPYLCDECHKIAEEELAKGKIYINGNLKRMKRYT